MTTANLESLLQDWAGAWSSPQGSARFISLFTEDGVYEDMATGHVLNGKSAIEDFYRQAQVAFPDFTVKLTSMVVAGNRGAAQWIMTGTQKGILVGIPATNNSISVQGASAFEFHGDKLKRCSDYYDMATMLKQLGI